MPPPIHVPEAPELRDQRRHLAEWNFDEARRELVAVGLRLFRHSSAHYSLSGRTEGTNWRLNIYPGEQQITPCDHADEFDRARDWTLLDVAAAMLDGREVGGG